MDGGGDAGGLVGVLDLDARISLGRLWAPNRRLLGDHLTGCPGYVGSAVSFLSDFLLLSLLFLFSGPHTLGFPCCTPPLILLLQSARSHIP
ncbi:hypothetical protein RHMOL_Rhmol12G0141200 [Rhododendron molle]|uniref:Uncharacterized protein n=1 Tax=Rhododendron molle TaxID=49168 RepID=A0ACC0LHX4_RHOML|nr:hypothetical protein RHMOL_Rhmol12G0141200 [Rhododendron molle]